MAHKHHYSLVLEMKMCWAVTPHHWPIKQEMRWVSLHVEVRRAIEMTQTHSKAWIFKYNHKRQERETQQQALKIKLRYNWLVISGIVVFWMATFFLLKGCVKRIVSLLSLPVCRQDWGSCICWNFMGKCLPP